MKNEILEHINHPSRLENLYRTDKATFTKAFDDVFSQIQEHPIAKTWYERLHYESSKVSVASSKEWLVILMASLLAGTISKFPELFHIDSVFFFTRNWAFIVFPILTAYFMWKNKASKPKVALAGFITLISVIYINLLPSKLLGLVPVMGYLLPTRPTDTTILACIHLPLFLWGILGVAFVGNNHTQLQPRLVFLKYTSELFIVTPIILLMGAILTGITLGLFNLLGIDIATFYCEYVVMFGISAAPIVGTYIIRTNANLVSKVLPAIAKVFSPLVLLTLISYLIAIPFSTQSLYQDRGFLFMFNMLLIGVMSLILFSVVGTLKQQKSRLEVGILFLLASTTIVINCIALSAIVSRLSEGFTPNRLAVLGGNVLILINLILVTHKLFLILKKDGDLEAVENTTARFLPVYILWIIVVLFIFPVVFGFR